MSEVKKPQEFWIDIATPFGDPCDFIHTEDPYEVAKRTNTHPCVAATNIHVIEKTAYDSLTAELELVKKERGEYLSIGQQYSKSIDNLLQERGDLTIKLAEAVKALEIAANQLEGVSLGIKTHGQNINVQFFIKTYANCAEKARQTLQKMGGGK